MSKYKNRTIKILDVTYSIKFVDRCPISEEQLPDSYNFGIFSPDTQTIYISTKDRDGKPLKESVIRQSLRHELMHLIFFEGQYISCYTDEPLVEWCAKVIGILEKYNIFSVSSSAEG